jgi:hypothetical protein
MADTKKAFYELKNTRFIEGDPRDEFLHHGAREAEPSPELTETQYFGFNIPEHDIHALCYLWHHPNLGVVSGGAWVWQGIKAGTLSCELFDWLNYVDDRVLAGDFHDVTLPNGYRSSVIEPFQRMRIQYADESSGNAFDIQYDAIAKPMVLETGFHLEQPMRTTGTLTLAGTEYTLDSYTVRDRSWGQARSELRAPIPPMAWMTGIFGEDLAFGTTAFDTAGDDTGLLAIPGGDPLRGGWIMRDGEYHPVVSVSKRTFRNAHTLFPESAELTIADDTGYTMELTGTVTAASNTSTWPNMDCVIALTRWECDGRVGYGDFQDVRYQAYLRAARAASMSRTAVRST